MARETFDHSYKGRYKFNQEGDLYIHHHVYCIGKAMQGNAMSDGDLAKTFSAQKTAAANATKTFYKTLFIDNLNLSAEELEMLKSTFEVNDEELMKMIDSAAKRKMDALMNKEGLDKLLQYQQNAIKTSKQIFSANSKMALEAFNNILEALSQSSALILSEYGPTLAQILSNLKMKRFVGINRMGEKLNIELDKFIKQNKITEVKDEQIFKVVSSLQTFATTLQKGQTTTDNPVTTKNIDSIIDSVFSPAFSEAIGSLLVDMGEGEARKVIKGSLTGTDTFKGVLTDRKGNIIGEYVDNATAQGKTDFSFKNFALSLEHSGKGDSREVSMNIGISSKLYRNLKFAKGNKIPSLTFSSGSAGTLEEAIEAIFPGNRSRQRYLAYNALARWAELDEATAALNDVLLTRQIIRMFATRGGSKDLSQYIFVNGTVVSILDLVKYVTDPSSALGKSSTKVRQKDSQAAAISIAGRPDLTKGAAINSALERTKEVNRVIKTSTISATLRVHKLIEALEPSS